MVNDALARKCMHIASKVSFHLVSVTNPNQPQRGILQAIHVLDERSGKETTFHYTILSMMPENWNAAAVIAC